MSGLLLLSVIAIWLAIVVFAAMRLARLFKPGAARNVGVAIAIAVMLPLPVADELISAPQLNKLCEEGTTLKFDPETIRGRTIFLAEGPSPQPRLSVGLLRGHYIPSRYLDATTKEELIAFNSYFLKGGLFIRKLGISEKNVPLTMRSYCAPEEEPWQKSFLNRYDLKRIERKDVK